MHDGINQKSIRIAIPDVRGNAARPATALAYGIKNIRAATQIQVPHVAFLACEALAPRANPLKPNTKTLDGRKSEKWWDFPNACA